MKITNLTLQPLRIPFRVAFKHASAERCVTQSFWVVARSEEGLTGCGEGCPRDYVTGETNVSVVAFFAKFRDSISARITDFPSLQEWTQAHREDIDRNPAAWCAIELALLDLLARQHNQSVEALLGLPFLTGPFTYSAVLGATGTQQFSATLERYLKLGIRDYKIKLSGDFNRDHGNLCALLAAGVTPTQVRADANNLWCDYDAARAYLKSLDFNFSAIEEPLLAGQFAELSLLAESLSTRIILDESITRESQIAQLPGTAEQWILNLRVSKMGGLIRSLRLIEACRTQQLSLIVGAQVGETSLLTRAALIVAQASRDILIAQEGAFGTLLLESDVVQPSLIFGTKGELDLPLRLEHSPGFGLTPIPGLIEHYFDDDTKEITRSN